MFTKIFMRFISPSKTFFFSTYTAMFTVLGLWFGSSYPIVHLRITNVLSFPRRILVTRHITTIKRMFFTSWKRISIWSFNCITLLGFTYFASTCFRFWNSHERFLLTLIRAKSTITTTITSTVNLKAGFTNLALHFISPATRRFNFPQYSSFMFHNNYINISTEISKYSN